MRATTVDGVRAYPLMAFEEKPSEHRARELLGLPGIAWNAGMFAWRRGAIRAAIEKYTPLMTLIEPAIGSDLALAAAYDRMTPISIDHAVMEGRRRRPPGRDGRDGRRLERSRQLDRPAGRPRRAGGSRSRLRERAGRPVRRDRRGPARRPGRPAMSTVSSPSRPRREGTIVADSVWAHLAGARDLEPAVQALLDRVASQEVRA